MQNLPMTSDNIVTDPGLMSYWIECSDTLEHCKSNYKRSTSKLHISKDNSHENSNPNLPVNHSLTTNQLLNTLTSYCFCQSKPTRKVKNLRTTW